MRGRDVTMEEMRFREGLKGREEEEEEEFGLDEPYLEGRLGLVKAPWVTFLGRGLGGEDLLASFR